MMLVGLDLNASRLRAVQGTSQEEPRTVAFEGQSAELPLALSLEGRSPVVGRAGLALHRRSPHLACVEFLPHLGTAKVWQVGKHQLDAEQALGHVLEAVQAQCSRTRGAAVALPSYLDIEQRGTLTRLAEQQGLRLLGSVEVPLAAALAAYAEQNWSGVALLVDVD